MAGSLLPVIILFVLVGGFAWMGYQMHIYTQTLAQRGQESMAKRNISFTKDGGVRVGVKEKSQEQYADQTQQWLVKAWNLSSWPAYKSMFWNKDEASGQTGKDRPSLSNKSSYNTGATKGGSATALNSRPAAVHANTK